LSHGRRRLGRVTGITAIRTLIRPERCARASAELAWVDVRVFA
jgi:hypothetical protein